MRVLDLFSGIGMMSLGLSWAGMETVGFCEIDPACRFWLSQNFSGVPIWTDIRSLVVDKDVNAIYDSRHGWTKKELRRRGESVQAGPVCGRCGCPLRHQSPSNVEDPASPWGSIQTAASLRKEEPFSQRNEGRRSRSEHAGEGGAEGTSPTEGALRGMRQKSNLQGRAIGDSGTSRRLQQAIEGDVALSTVPSRMAQEEPCCSASRKEVMLAEASRPVLFGSIDVVAGGFP